MCRDIYTWTSVHMAILALNTFYLIQEHDIVDTSTSQFKRTRQRHNLVVRKKKGNEFMYSRVNGRRQDRKQTQGDKSGGMQQNPIPRDQQARILAF